MFSSKMKHRSMHLLIKYTETLTRRGNKKIIRETEMQMHRLIYFNG